MRHLIFRFGHFHRVFAVVQPVLVPTVHQHELLAIDVWLGQIHRIGRDNDVRQEIAMPDVVFNDRRQITARNAAAPVEFFLDVSGRDRKNVAVPFSS